jgi:hypothetical protein
MLQALQYLASNPGKDVYQALFFDQGVKFQYPLTSLLFVEWLRAVAAPAVPVLNLINKLLFGATVGGMVFLSLGLADRTELAAQIAERSNRVLIAAVAAAATLCFYPLLIAVSLVQVQILLAALFVFGCYFHVRGQSAASRLMIGSVFDDQAADGSVPGLGPSARRSPFHRRMGRAGCARAHRLGPAVRSGLAGRIPESPFVHRGPWGKLLRKPVRKWVRSPNAHERP